MSNLLTLVKKDLRLMVASKFVVLALGSLLLYSLYINLLYVKVDQAAYPVYLYDPTGVVTVTHGVLPVESEEELQRNISDVNAIGINVSGGTPEIQMISSGRESIDNNRAAYAHSLLASGSLERAEIIGTNNKEMKNRREITAEFLFFELSAVGFLGLASALFKEKQMGVIRVHGVLPMNRSAFVFSKLLVFLMSDLLFATLLTFINLGISAALPVLPMILLQAAILSLIMALVGFFCAVWLPDFKQFSLLYLVLAIFITTPVFLSGQAGISWAWMNFHPMYHLFMGMKNAYFSTNTEGAIYYVVSAVAIVLLFLLARRTLSREMVKEG